MGRACDCLWPSASLVIEVFVRKAYKVVSDPVTLVRHCPSKHGKRHCANTATGVLKLEAKHIALNV